MVDMSFSIRCYVYAVYCMKLSNKNCWNLRDKVSACIGPTVIRASVKMGGPMGIGSSNFCYVFIVQRPSTERRFQQFRSHVATERNNGNGTTERHNGTAERQRYNGNGQRQQNGGKQALLPFV